MVIGESERVGTAESSAEKIISLLSSMTMDGEDRPGLRGSKYTSD